MAHLVAVCRDGEEEYPFNARQIPLCIDDTLTMVIEFPSSELEFAGQQINSFQMKQFIEHHNMLKEQNLKVALVVMSREMFSSLSELVPCVGCRRSVERLFTRIADAGFYALEPLTVDADGVLSISNSCLEDPRQLYTLFYVHGSKLNDAINAIPKAKKNKRCQLHSLDTHKARPLGGSWIDVWERMSQECREEVVLIDNACLLETLETYLQKHRFCTDCKNKVLRAYNILVGELECSKEEDYCASLYEGLRCCPQDHHIHVCAETDFIAHLLGRAEPEFIGAYERRERHAKTIDVAQEEVLTCLGIHLFERLHRIWQKLRAEEQTWQLLYYFCIDRLRKNFEMTVDEIKGFCRLEQLCEELSEEERAKELRQEKKRQKRKNRRKNKCVSVCEQEENDKADKEKILDEGLAESVDGGCKSCGSGEEFGGSVEVVNPMENCTCSTTAILCSPKTKNGVSSHCNGSDCGYSSSMEGSELGSREGSDVACSEGMCNHDETGEDTCSHPCTEDKEEDGMYSCVVCWANSNEQTQGKSKKKKRKNKAVLSENKQDLEKDESRPDNSRIVPEVETSPGFTSASCDPPTCPDQNPDRTSVSLQQQQKGSTKFSPRHPTPPDPGPHADLSIKTLMELLDEAAMSTDEEICLTPDEIRSFVEENKSFYSKRHQYRQHLKDRFTKYCHSSSVCSAALCLATNSVQ